MEPDGGTTNIRNVKEQALDTLAGVRSTGCVVPFNSFSEFNKDEGGDVWFALDESRPLACFAGIWANWTSVRKVKEGETTNDLYAFLTTEANAEVGAIHPKAMPVILTTPDQVETWMTAPSEEALKLQRPLPDGTLADRCPRREGRLLPINDVTYAEDDLSAVWMIQKESQHFLRGIRPVSVRIGSGGASSRPGMACAVDIPVLEDRALAVDVGRSGIFVPSRNLPAMHLLLRHDRSDRVFSNLNAIVRMHGGVAIAVKNNGRDHRAGRRRTSAVAPLPHGGECRGHIGSGSISKAGMDPDRRV